MRKKFLFAAGIIAILVFPVTEVVGAEYVVPTRGTGNLVISRQIQEDLYAAGGNVSVSTTVPGDLFVAGGSLNLTSAIGGDLFAAGGNINVSQPVSGDARIGGGNITIGAPIGEDLLVGGGTVTVAESSRIGGDLWAGGGSITVDGEVAGNVKIGGGEVLLNGRIGGTVEIQAETLTFGPQSVVTGKIVYKGSKEATIEQGAQVSQIEFQHVAKRGGGSRGKVFAFGLVELLALGVASLLAYRFFRGTALSAASNIKAAYWKNFGIGLLSMIVTPILIVILFVSIIGFYLGLILLAAFGLTLLLSCLASAIFTGYILHAWLRKDEPELGWIWVLLGIVVYWALWLVPFIGWIAVVLIFLATFGQFVFRIKASLGQRA